MVIKPKTRGFICTTAHPVGCAKHVQEQIEYVKSQPAINGPKRVLVIGASQGFGLASRIAATFGMGAGTIGLFFERPAENGRTATAGWYNSAAFEQAAREAGYFAKSINGDAFSNEIKQQTVDAVREHFGQVDLVVYSLASPRRTHPVSGETFNSVLKPIGAPYTNKTVNFHSGEVSDVTIEPASEEEIQNTVTVMGGEDWEMWIDTLQREGVLAEGATTVAYSYIGPEVTHAIYREGTIGRAKEHLEATAHRLHDRLHASGGRAYVSVNKALVTQASSAIPIVPLYISLLYKIMKEQGVHEGTIEQMYRLFAGYLYTDGGPQLDEKGRIRVDNLEMRGDIQEAVAKLWPQVSTENLAAISDIEGYREEFFRLFGFHLSGVDYEADVNENVPMDA
ncbi:enoyl-ACP reductase FabV [Paenibacillus turpanensis]|uniref:enoyl-ACP reductase FabV n=1 Tax=Paenibacillus turpanensis TaxID=2689078 RepID=UPI0014088080|nr:enoyl-ACP reductase FabV [Paenibacillus turpanensis]